MMDSMRFDNGYIKTRSEKAEKIVTILQDFTGHDLMQYSCLDLGCALGIITKYVKNSFKSTFGVEIDEKLVKQAISLPSQGSIFVVADGGKTPFPSRSFDVIICAQVYEHTPDPQLLSNEIWRLLKTGGMCFFSGPNRWSPIEEHYWLPFLSWFPRPLANLYLRLVKKVNRYDVNPLYYWQLRSLFHNFEIHDYTIQLFRHPEKFALSSKGKILKIVKHLPDWFLIIFILWWPNYNWILVKKN
jgi:SAM-dependent methyltransferase